MWYKRVIIKDFWESKTKDRHFENIRELKNWDKMAQHMLMSIRKNAYDIEIMEWILLKKAFSQNSYTWAKILKYNVKDRKIRRNNLFKKSFPKSK